MKSPALSSLFLTLSLILISHSPLAANAKSGAKLVAKVCKGAMEDRAPCMSLLRADPRFSFAKNYVQLSKLILEVALRRGTEGQNFLKEVAKMSNSPAIAQCANFDYDGVVGSFRSALGEVEEDGETANYDAKVAGDGSESCERGLVAANINNPAVSALNKEISLLSKVAFLATNNLS